MNEIKVAELFAGVGGFRLGLENTNEKMFNVTWANQWEPSKKYNMPLIVIIVIFQLEYISMKISL